MLGISNLDSDTSSSLVVQSRMFLGKGSLYASSDSKVRRSRDGEMDDRVGG